MMERCKRRSLWPLALAAGALAAMAAVLAVTLTLGPRGGGSPTWAGPPGGAAAPEASGLRELSGTATALAPTLGPGPTAGPRPSTEAPPPAQGEVAASTLPPTPPPPPPPPAPPQAPAGGALDPGLAAELLALVNAERKARGLTPLSSHPALVSSSTAYALLSLELDWHQHTGADGRTFAERVRAAGFTANVYLGEVLGWGWGGWTPRDIVQSWLQSPPHSQLMLDPAFSLAGAGCAIRYDGDGRRIHCVLDMAGQ